MFGKELFIDGLKQLDILAQDKGENRITFPYTIGAGRFNGKSITVGIEVPPDFAVTCPTGPHVSPRLIAINTQAPGNDRSAESPNFGPDWQYLSRPFVNETKGWNRTSKDVKAYLRHVKRILETL